MINITQAIITFLLVLTLSTALHAQELNGQWNGSLQTSGTTYRIVFHIHQNGNIYEATLDSPDQNAAGITITTVTRDQADVKFEIQNLGIKYEGLLSDNRISGKWMQSGMTFPLVLERAEPATEKKE